MFNWRWLDSFKMIINDSWLNEWKKLNAYPTVGLKVGINKFWRFGVIWHNVSFLRDFFFARFIYFFAPLDSWEHQSPNGYLKISWFSWHSAARCRTDTGYQHYGIYGVRGTINRLSQKSFDTHALMGFFLFVCFNRSDNQEKLKREKKRTLPLFQSKL